MLLPSSMKELRGNHVWTGWKADAVQLDDLGSDITILYDILSDGAKCLNDIKPNYREDADLNALVYPPGLTWPAICQLKDEDRKLGKELKESEKQAQEAVSQFLKGATNSPVHCDVSYLNDSKYDPYVKKIGVYFAQIKDDEVSFENEDRVDVFITPAGEIIPAGLHVKTQPLWHVLEWRIQAARALKK